MEVRVNDLDVTNRFHEDLETIRYHLIHSLQLPVWKVKQMQQLTDGVILHLSTGENKKMTIDFSTQNHVFLGNVEIPVYPQLIEWLPRYNQSGDFWEYAHPHILLVNANDFQPYMDTIIFHELTHLFAVSIKKSENGEIEYKSGINYYRITKNDDIYSKSDVNLNEYFTDLAASILYKRLCKSGLPYCFKNKPDILYERWPELKNMDDEKENDFLERYFTNIAP